MTAALSEKALQDTVREMCKAMGLLAYHTHDSRRSEPGFPDLVVVGRGGLLFRELKTDTGRVTQHQNLWLAALLGAGADADVWRPRNLRAGQIAEQLAAIRSRRKEVA